MKNIRIVSRIYEGFGVNLCQECYSYANELKVDRNLRAESTDASCEMCYDQEEANDIFWMLYDS